ncbi:DivIVA domain-containing protein [Streptococcus rupicaprae]|uniref:Cell cycle protein GpsB n=1 Tax=Streptococcus rupicaprae TaxID=759619 RepID=A0ABV2FHE0_9STRE
MAGIKYTTKDIFEQEFKITMRGYSKEEVDEFLDDIMKDYDTYEAKIKELKAEISRLKAEPKNESVSAVSTPIAERPEFARATTATNFDILKRINRLEKEVFGKQIMEE